MTSPWDWNDDPPSNEWRQPWEEDEPPTWDDVEDWCTPEYRLEWGFFFDGEDE